MTGVMIVRSGTGIEERGEPVSDGWKLATLKRRRSFLAERLAKVRIDGKTHHRATKHDQREHDALDWAIDKLDNYRQCDSCFKSDDTVEFYPHSPLVGSDEGDWLCSECSP